MQIKAGSQKDPGSEEVVMRHGLVCLGAVLLTGFSISSAQQQQEKAKETATTTASAPTDAAKPGAVDERKNPVKVTPEGIATVKKIYGYDCAMCHGAAGDGKGDVAASMGLKMKDWRDPGVLSALSDGQMYDIIVKGKDK